MANKILPVIVFASMVVVTSVVGVTFFYLGKALAEKECREAATATATATAKVSYGKTTDGFPVVKFTVPENDDSTPNLPLHQ